MPCAATWMALQIAILSEVSQRGKISLDITYMWNLKRNYTNELTKLNETHRLREHLKVSQHCYSAIYTPIQNK